MAESERADLDEPSPPGSPVNSPGLFLGASEGSFAFEVNYGSCSEDEADPEIDWDWDYSDTEDEAADSVDQAADGQLDVGAELEGPDVLEGMATADAEIRVTPELGNTALLCLASQPTVLQPKPWKFSMPELLHQ